MAVPTIITTKLAELEQLCEKYPSKIPIEDCAAFLGMSGESLRACLEHGSCPFGLGWLKKNAHNRAFYIPTLTFYLWVTQSAGFREGSGMNRIHVITAGLSFLGLLSATGYAELDKLSMGAYTVLALFLLAVFAVCADRRRAHEKRRCQDGNPDQRQRKIYSTT